MMNTVPGADCPGDAVMTAYRRLGHPIRAAAGASEAARAIPALLGCIEAALREPAEAAAALEETTERSLGEPLAARLLSGGADRARR